MMDGDFEAAHLSVRLGAVAANYKTFQRLAGPAAVSAVVKADAYGLGAAHGDAHATAGTAGCDTFFVARVQEGILLRPLVPKARIFVFDGAPPGSVPALITHHPDSGAQFARRDRRLVGGGASKCARRSMPRSISIPA